MTKKNDSEHAPDMTLDEPDEKKLGSDPDEKKLGSRRAAKDAPPEGSVVVTDKNGDNPYYEVPPTPNPYDFTTQAGTVVQHSGATEDGTWTYKPLN